MSSKKRRFGDRVDGARVRDLESYHKLLPHLLPKRCDSVAFMRETIDVGPLMAYLEKKNVDAEVKTTLFQVFIAAIVRTFALRPKMNRFICGRRFYQRDVIDVGFIVKRVYEDDAEENIARLDFDQKTTLSDVTEKLTAIIHKARSESTNDTMDVIDFVTKIPRPLTAFILKIFRILNYFGKMPISFTKFDPDFASVFVSNMGSIKAGAPYHHLNEWGTNSVFICIGEKRKTPMATPEGELYVSDAIDFTFTLDERLADGFYYAKAISIFKDMILHPELLETLPEELQDKEEPALEPASEMIEQAS